MTPDDPSGRLIALRDQFLRQAQALEFGAANLGFNEVRTAKANGKAEAYRACAADLDGLITALLRPQREETKEDPTDDPRNPRLRLRANVEPTR